MASLTKNDPVLDSEGERTVIVPASVAVQPTPPSPAPGEPSPPRGSGADNAQAGLDQVSRIEDKTARIEEKFARSEERMMRVESALEKATLRLEGATQDMNLQGVRDDMARMQASLRRKPGVATLFVVALLASLIGAGVSFALVRYGVPGVIAAPVPTVAPQ